MSETAAVALGLAILGALLVGLTALIPALVTYLRHRRKRLIQEIAHESMLHGQCVMKVTLNNNAGAQPSLGVVRWEEWSL